MTISNPHCSFKRSTINIDGDNIVGVTNTGDGFLYDGSIWTTFNFPGARFTVASDIDGDNIAGTYWDASAGHAFLHDGSTWASLDFPGAVFTAAYGIDGDKIVGFYRDASEKEHGFVYTIPDPGAILLVGFGGLGVLRKRRLVKG